MVDDAAFLALPAADFEASCQFFEAVLGLRRSAENGVGIRSADFRTPSLTVRIYEWKDAFKRGGHTGLFLEVGSIQDAHRRLSEAGVEVTEVRKEPWGGTVCTFSDPDGNRIDLIQKG